MSANQELFFEPWIGPEYKYGIKLDAHGNLEFFKPKDSEKEEEWEQRRKKECFYKVMALGLEHYCEKPGKVQQYNCEQKNYIENLTSLCKTVEKTSLYQKKALESVLEQLSRQSCRMHQGSTDCGKLYICKQYTKVVIQQIIDKVYEPSSHENFCKTLNPNAAPSVWNHLLFANCFQRSMPHEAAAKNADCRKSLQVRQEAVRAFAHLLKSYMPDIIIVWGKEDKEPGAVLFEDQKKGNILREAGLEILLNPKNEIPRINIANYESSYTLPFTIVKNKEANKKCLIIFLNHPAWPYHTRNRQVRARKIAEYQAKNHKNLVCFFRYYKELVKWNNTLSVYDQGKKHFTCQFTEDLTWSNEAGFPKKNT